MDIFSRILGRGPSVARSEAERELLSGIEEFVNTEVEQIMRPRLDITAVSIDDDFARLKQVILESGFSRIPVYEQTLDNIKGVLYVKDMIAYVGESNDFAWQKHLREPYFVPQNKKINDLLAEFQTNKVHLGIVVDEYGSTTGLVSLEDILEEVVGEIVDEWDTEPGATFVKLDEDRFIFPGKTHINELTEATGLEEGFFDDVRGEAETVAGLLLELKGDFLRKGESVVSKKVRFTALSFDARRIDRVKVQLER